MKKYKLVDSSSDAGEKYLIVDVDSDACEATFASLELAKLMLSVINGGGDLVWTPTIRIDSDRPNVKFEPVAGRNMHLEVAGGRIAGEMMLDISKESTEIVTATVTMIMPEIKYRGE